jgi:putative nucleotidyltransferase with HDIG domain
MNAQTIAAQIESLPPVSPSALKLIGMLDRLDVTNDEISALIKQDCALTANVLRLCNSSVSGLPVAVTSVDQAVLVLGHRQLLRIVLAAGFGHSLSRPLPGYAVSAGELWRHALVTALAAELLACEVAVPEWEPAVAYTSGLLHDIGKLALDRVLTPHVQESIRTRIREEGLSRLQAEQDALHTNHAEVGAALLSRWRVPDVIVEAVAGHHQPKTTAPPNLSALVHVANCLAHLAGSAPGWEGYAIHVHSAAVEAIGLDSNAIESLVLRVQDSLQQVEALMEAA